MKGIDHTDPGSIMEQTEYEGTRSHTLTSGTSFPGSPSEPELFYRTDEHKWYFYNGTTWVNMVN